VDGEQALVDVGERAARELPLDAPHELEDGGLALTLRPDGLAREAPPEALAEGPLGAAVLGRVVEEVVGERVEHAVGKEAGSHADRETEPHLQAVADPDVAEGLPKVLEAKVRGESPRLASEGPRGGEELVREEETAVAGGPEEPLFAEGLQALADRRAPCLPLALGLRQPLRLGGQRVDEAERGPLVRQVAEPPHGRPEVGQGGRGPGPQPDVLVTQGGHATPQRTLYEPGRNRGGRRGCPHAGRYAPADRVVPAWFRRALSEQALDDARAAVESRLHQRREPGGRARLEVRAGDLLFTRMAGATSLHSTTGGFDRHE
jgi:hypothetical protein